MRYLAIIFTFLLSIQLYAGDDYNFEFVNAEYDDFIATVTFEHNNLPVGFQAIKLGSSDFLMLKFDDLNNVERHLYYRIIHCDKDWKPSAMREIDYLNGFNDERLRNYEYSTSTRIQYIHYWQRFPNKDTNFKISGNYLLVIYEDNIDRPVLTRRFIVSENIVGIEVNDIFPSDVMNIRYKQEFDVNLINESISMRNPIEEVNIVMLQNENWNNTKTSKPNFIAGSTMRFNKLGTFEWWGNSEFREFDIRSFFRVGRGVKFIERKRDETDILLQPIQSWRNKVHIAVFDFNGKFFIENWDALQGASYLDISDNVDAGEIQTTRNNIVGDLKESSEEFFRNNVAEPRNINSDYAYITLYLEDDIQLDDDENIYILGAFNNWTPSDAYRMTLDYNRGMYVGNLFLKQGYYNYCLAVVKDGIVDVAAMDGSWNETENDYQVIVYYKGLGDLYDRIIGFTTYNTNLKTRQY
ncbi:MAG: DUF5103 domain-containing protein [Saprospiraceae bacterium]|nr:MAG: hypothetical protein UZ09_BCD002001616 [Bacteroidetes bacterium OLB9]MCO6464043.1 DUF5103 domain-containing protein [Saprospiraceae bacterium]MCZ2337674.1 DUF5103 domain-containing protein [Chitinophagales bacterium]